MVVSFKCCTCKKKELNANVKEVVALKKKKQSHKKLHRSQPSEYYMY